MTGRRGLKPPLVMFTLALMLTVLTGCGGDTADTSRENFQASEITNVEMTLWVPRDIIGLNTRLGDFVDTEQLADILNGMRRLSEEEEASLTEVKTAGDGELIDVRLIRIGTEGTMYVIGNTGYYFRVYKNAAFLLITPVLGATAKGQGHPYESRVYACASDTYDQLRAMFDTE